MESEKWLVDASKWESFYHELRQSLEVYNPYDDGYEDALDRVDDWMDAQPTVDAVEVVRCKDCKWFKKGTPFRHECNNICAGMFYVRQEDFCSYGERKDNG